MATRKLRPPLCRREARGLVVAYGEWVVTPTDVSMISAASSLEEALMLSYWDALIVEAARRSNAVRLLTEDLHHGALLAGVLVENLFPAAQATRRVELPTDGGSGLQPGVDLEDREAMAELLGDNRLWPL